MTANKTIITILIFALFAETGITQKRSIPNNPTQKIVLKGRVTERSSGEPLSSALVKVKDARQHALSDKDGNYTLLFDQKGAYVITASYIGYQEESRHITVGESNAPVNFAMEESDYRLEEILVTSRAPDERVKSLTMGVEKLNAREIKQMPALMGEVDALKAIQLLPGVQVVAEGGSGYSVRGGAPDQNLILLDNTTIYNASHLLGFFSIFNNDALGEIELYKGDMPLKHGGRLSSLLDVRTKAGASDKLSGTGGVGLISSRLMIEGLIGGKTSWLVGGRRSYADLFLKMSSEEALRKTSLYFFDLNGKMSHRFSNRDVVDFNGYYGKDHFGGEVGDFQYGNTALSFSWKHVYSEQLLSKISFNTSRYDYGIISSLSGSEINWQSGITDYTVRADMTHSISRQWNLSYGLTSTLHAFQPGHATLLGKVDHQVASYDALEHSLYLSNEQYLSDVFSVKYGTRLSAFQNIGRATVYRYDADYQATDSTVYSSGKIYNTYAAWEPRIGFVWQLEKSASIKGGYAHNVQFIQLANNSASGSPLNIWFAASPNVKPQTVHMFSAGYFRNLNDNMYETSAELYYKRHLNVIDFAEHAELTLNKYLEGEIRTGNGRSYGIELMARKNHGALTGFVNYTLSRSERAIPEINQGKTYLSPYDKTHSFNLVANYQLSKKCTVSAIWVYATGNPTTYPSGRFEIGGEYFPIYSGRNEYRRPDYHRLDLSFTYTPKSNPKKPWQEEWNVSLYNAYGKKNPWIITYSQNEETKLPYAEMMYLFGIVPSISYNFKF